MVLLLGMVSAHAQISIPPGGSLSLPPGAQLQLSCGQLDVQGTLDMGNAQIASAGQVNIGQGGTLNAGQGTLSVSNGWANSGSFQAGSSTVAFNDSCGAGSITITGQTVFHNLTLTSTTGQTFVLAAGSTITVNGTLSLQGSPSHPLQLISSNGQPVQIVLGPQAQALQSYVNIASSVQIGNPASLPGIPALPPLGWLLLLLGMSAMAWRRTFRREHHS